VLRSIFAVDDRGQERFVFAANCFHGIQNLKQHV